MHSKFVIDRFRGEATNQKSRLTNAPTRVVGKWDRLGGVSPLAEFSAVSNQYDDMFYDWTGVSVFKDGTGTANIVMAYNQTGALASSTASEFYTATYPLYVPGGGMYALEVASSANNNPSILAAYHVNYDGSIVYRTPLPSSYGPSIYQIGGSFDAGSRLHALFIYFRRTPHGLIPTDIFWGVHTTTASSSGWQIKKSAFPLTNDLILAAYIRVYDAASGDVVEWDRIWYGVDGSDTPFVSSLGYTVTAFTDVSKNAVPYLYGAADTYAPAHYTFSQSRAFYVASSPLRAFKIVTDGASPYDVKLDPVEGYSTQHVFFTDEGHLGFSDTINAPFDEPNVLKFDDRLNAITPSVRGIYAMSDVGTWEAYGDFETVQNTRISLVPVLGGADDNPNGVTFSGDTAYFIKNGIVHSIGSAGVKAIGKAIHKNVTNVSAVYYDRFARRLYAVYYRNGSDLTIGIYDPAVDAWSEFPTVSPNILYTNVPIVIAENRIIFRGNDILLVPANPEPITVEFEKVDMQQPNRRKKVHQIILPYDGTYASVSVQIADANGGSYVACKVNDRGGYYDIRCPSVVARAFKIKIDVSPTDTNFALTPPVIFMYTAYGANYGAE